MRILLLVFALFLGGIANEAFADEAPQKVDKNVVVNYNGQNIVKVWLKQNDKQNYTIKVYDLNFTLLHAENLNNKPNLRFDVSKFNDGFYFVTVEKNAQAIHTEIIEKISEPILAKY